MKQLAKIVLSILCVMSILINSNQFIYAQTDPITIYRLSTEDIVLIKGNEYQLPSLLNCCLSSLDIEILGNDGIIEKIGPRTIKAIKCGTIYVTYYMNNVYHELEVSVYPPHIEVTEDIFHYPYLTIDKTLTTEEKYLLQYGYDSLEQCVKDALLSYKVPIVISNGHFDNEEYKRKSIVGAFSYDGNPYIIYLKADVYGIDAFTHEVGHFWSAINGGLCYSEENQKEFQEDPYNYNNYNPNSISEFYACKFKQQHMKNYKWYPYGLEDGYTP